MPKGNTIGNRKLKYGRSSSHFSTEGTKVDRSLAGLLGHMSMGWKKHYELSVQGDKYRVILAIKLYCLHKHKNKTVTDLCTIYNQRTDDVRRMLHSTKRMFDKWRELNEESQIN